MKRANLRKLRPAVEGRLSRAAFNLGYELHRKHYYLPFPELDRLPESTWKSPSALPGVDLRIAEGLQLLRQLRGWVEEFAAIDFDIRTGSYEEGDAETLYGMIRHLKPRQLVELGSGASSHIIALAGAENVRDGHPMDFDAYDPHAGWHHLGAAPGAKLHRIPSEELDVKVIDKLQAGDVLFVDTTHTVKTGGDVNRILLELLPRIADGVYVHIHDIFLPFEYPMEWLFELRRAWAEQYLLQAFLAFNSAFEVVLPLHALYRMYSDEVAACVPSTAALIGTGPAAFWIRRKGKCNPDQP